MLGIMLSLLLASVALSTVAGATHLFDRNLVYHSPFVNAPHVSLFFPIVVCNPFTLVGCSCHTTQIP